MDLTSRQYWKAEDCPCHIERIFFEYPCTISSSGYLFKHIYGHIIYRQIKRHTFDRQTFDRQTFHSQTNRQTSRQKFDSQKNRQTFVSQTNRQTFDRQKSRQTLGRQINKHGDRFKCVDRILDKKSFMSLINKKKILSSGFL